MGETDVEKKKKRGMISKKFCLDISEELKCAENEKKKKNQRGMCD